MSIENLNPFVVTAKRLIKAIPRGKVATYGQIAAMAGDPRGARQVARILHSCSRKDGLPWHRVINRQGRISLPRGYGYEEQKTRLEKEGIIFDRMDMIDFDKYQWNGKIKRRK